MPVQAHWVGQGPVLAPHETKSQTGDALVGKCPHRAVRINPGKHPPPQPQRLEREHNVVPYRRQFHSNSGKDVLFDVGKGQALTLIEQARVEVRG